jgi:hypothetical protein
VFVGVETSNGFSPYGTGLLGIVAYGEFGNTVLITARHIMDTIPGDFLSIRINRVDGGAGTAKFNKSTAITFKDKALDLAVIPVGFDYTSYDAYAIPLQSAAWKLQVDALGEPSFGDEVCVVGLYTSHYGHVRNIPVVRIGHISALPEELVMTDTDYASAYLIECHSIAGISGSPVYFNVPQVSVVDGHIRKLDRPTHVPLGIVVGYHIIESREDQIVVPTFQQVAGNRQPLPPTQNDERRTGFAVVLPIQRVYELFEGKEMKKVLEASAEGIRRKSGYRRAAAIPPVEIEVPSADENLDHKKDFKRLVDVAAKNTSEE